MTRRTDDLHERWRTLKPTSDAQGSGTAWELGTGTTLTHLLAVLFGFQSNDLQDAGVGDVGDNVSHPLPDTQQGATQHVVLPQTHAQPTLVAHFLLFTLALPGTHIDIIKQNYFNFV